jgi:nucleotide-binding universal stress UspA family protein
MNGGTGRVPRMIVGVGRSRASWWALAWAVEEARRRGAHLLLVHVFRPSAAPVVADYRYGVLSAPQDPYGDRMEHGYTLIREAITRAVDWMPGDVAIEQQVLPGRPAVELARLAGRPRHRARVPAPGAVAPTGPGLGGACLRAAR